MKLSKLLFVGVVFLCSGALFAQDKGVQFWVSDPVAAYLDLPGTGAGKDIKPIKIVGARNGTFSGKVVVGSGAALSNVTATITDLQMADKKGTIPAASVQIRMATGSLKSTWQVLAKASSTFDVLEDALSAPSAPLAADSKSRPWMVGGRSCVPVWVTVNVPADAPAGEYTGTLTVKAGAASQAVPVTLSVSAYALPAPKDWKTWVEAIQSPDTLAMEYNVPLWSDAHWKLIEESLKYGAMLGNKTVYIPLICGTNFGNAESYVRWIKDGEGKYKHDFSVVEKYLDLQIKYQGKPEIVVFQIHDNFLDGGSFSGDIKYEPKEAQAERLAYQGKGPEVTILDPATGKTTKIDKPLPPYSDPASQALWAPLFQQIPDILKKRGLEKTLCVGMVNDNIPAKTTADFAMKNLPGAKWIIHAHSFYGGKDKMGEFRYATFVWGVKSFCSGGKGWLDKGPLILTQFLRNIEDNWPISTYRMAPEVNITGGQRGVGRLGLDYWKVVKNKKGVRDGQVWQLYPKANWRNLNITSSLLAPGKTGPLATARFEMLREGTQECEARIYIQTALDAKKLPADLAAKCQKVLADRDAFLKKAAISTGQRPWFAQTDPTEEMYMGYATGWQAQSEALYQVAGEIAKLGVK